ncbi:MlaE family ABC transporter permease [Amycolatopsis marina]|nr:ABC transporter permease [Amycolatopsis marina]
MTQTVRERVIEAPLNTTTKLGDQVNFYARALAWTPLAITRYRKEILRQIAAVSFGTGGLALIGGTAAVVAILTGAMGIEIGLQGHSQLTNVGVEALSGFVSAYVNTRNGAPLVAGIALVATVGAGFTAELGAMRISEEIDALDVMAVPSIPYLVTTRIIAGMIAVTPLYAVALIAAYALTRATVIVVFGQSAGTYDHYFSTFLIPSDILSSYLTVLAMSVVVMCVHCYFGFKAEGGPAGVGLAVGKAVRTSLIAIMFVALAATITLYGNTDTLHISR